MHKFNKLEMRDGKAVLFWSFAILQFIAGFILFIVTLASKTLPKWTLLFWLPWMILNIIDMIIVSRDQSKGALQVVGWISFFLFGLVEGLFMVILADYVRKPEELKEINKENKIKNNQKSVQGKK